MSPSDPYETARRSAEAVEHGTRVARRAALERGRARQKENAALKKMIRAEQINPDRLMAGTLPADDEISQAAEQLFCTWTIDKALRTMPGLGPARTMWVIGAFRASPNTKIGALSYKRREELARLAAVARGGNV